MGSLLIWLIHQRVAAQLEAAVAYGIQRSSQRCVGRLESMVQEEIGGSELIGAIAFRLFNSTAIKKLFPFSNCKSPIVFMALLSVCDDGILLACYPCRIEVTKTATHLFLDV
ncbi:hypothetical protein BDB01DRAFT_777380, partial [Pilobolus umbonatus]